jgi:hypothetical protein
MRTKSRRLLQGLKPIQTKVTDDLNYYLGLSVGENIVNNFLPTLSTDMLKTDRIIEVSEEETKIWEEISAEYTKKYLWATDKEVKEEGTREFYKNLKWYKILKEKYLPKTLTVRITKVKPTNIIEFQKGIKEALWDCDLSHYKVIDGFFEEGHEYSWCSKITLTRYLGTIPEKYL